MTFKSKRYLSYHINVYRLVGIGYNTSQSFTGDALQIQIPLIIGTNLDIVKNTNRYSDAKIH